MATKTINSLRPADLALQFDQLDDLDSQIKALKKVRDDLNDKLIATCQTHGFKTVEATVSIFTLTEPAGTTYDDDGILGALKPGQLKLVTYKALDHAKFKSALEIGAIKREQVAQFITAKEIKPSFRRTVKVATASA